MVVSLAVVIRIYIIYVNLCGTPRRRRFIASCTDFTNIYNGIVNLSSLIKIKVVSKQ